jgi:diadenosine tetraphosphate (Ap4A) HIT family hydrolase
MSAGMVQRFELHPRLAADTHEIARLALSRLLLMNDSRWPWLILVPQRPDLREIHDLVADARVLLIEEIARAGRALQMMAKPDKINVGMLGNLVPQLHIHVVARFATDPAWPGPVWGFGTRTPYTDAALAGRRGALLAAIEATAKEG